MIRNLLEDMIARQASDLHLVAGYKPTFRVNGELVIASEVAVTSETAARMIREVTPEPVRQRLDQVRDVDFSIEVPTPSRAARVRVNIFYHQQSLGACFRLIPEDVPSWQWAGFPEELADRVVHQRNGLVLVAGMTGAGKSTTLAMLVNKLNTEGGYRIITVEEPIEYVFSTLDDSVVTQREVGVDVGSFYDGLKYGLRQDPDVILVGEIRDRQTAQMALSAAETGHLIFSTLHTNDARGAITRFVDLFPTEAQEDVRTQLSLSLRHVISQHLLPSATPGDKRVLAFEVLVANHPVQSLVRQGKVESIDTAIQTGKRDGMMALDEHLNKLVGEGKVTPDVARFHAKDPSRITALPHQCPPGLS